MVSVCTIMIVKNVDKYKQTLCEQVLKYMCAAKDLKAWDPLDCQGFIKSDLLL